MARKLLALKPRTRRLEERPACVLILFLVGQQKSNIVVRKAIIETNTTIRLPSSSIDDAGAVFATIQLY